MDPATPSARMSAASLAETTMMQLSSCSTVSSSPTWMPALLPSGGRLAMAVSEAVSTVSRASSPRSTASSTSRAVMTLVVLAG